MAKGIARLQIDDSTYFILILLFFLLFSPLCDRDPPPASVAQVPSHLVEMCEMTSTKNRTEMQKNPRRVQAAAGKILDAT